MNRSWYTLIHIQKQNSRPHTLFFSRVSFWHIWASHLFRGPPPVALIVSAHYHVLQLLCSNLPARRDGIGVQGILEREKERSCDDTLRHFWSNTYTRLVLFLIFKISRTLTPIQPTVPFLLDNPPKRRQHTLLWPILARNMHPALNRNIRIRNTRRQQLPQRPQIKRISRRNPPPLLQTILQLLKNSILQDGINNQHKRRHHTREQPRGTLLPQQRKERPKGRRRLRLRRSRQRIIRLRLAGRHPRVNHPDRVRNEHGCAARERTRKHGLHGGEFLAGAPGLERRLFEERPRPFVPVVVDEIGDADAEERRVEAGVEAWDALALDDATGGGERRRRGAFGFDLGAG